jgi:hypothetical protein
MPSRAEPVDVARERVVQRGAAVVVGLRGVGARPEQEGDGLDVRAADGEPERANAVARRARVERAVGLAAPRDEAPVASLRGAEEAEFGRGEHRWRGWAGSLARGELARVCQTKKA